MVPKGRFFYAVIVPVIVRRGKRGRPKNANDDPSPVTPNIKICSNWFSIIGKGLLHICSSKRANDDNIQKLQHTTPTSSQRVASGIIKDSATPLPSTLAKPLPVNDFQIKKKQLFSVESTSMIQKDLNLSNRKVLTLAEDLRTSSGSRKVIEKGMKGKLCNLHHQLEDLFKTEKYTFVLEIKGWRGRSGEKEAAYWKIQRFWGEKGWLLLLCQIFKKIISISNVSGWKLESIHWRRNLLLRQTSNYATFFWELWVIVSRIPVLRAMLAKIT